MLPVGAKSLPILTPDYWHPPQSNFTEYKQDIVAKFLCTCQWSMSWLASPVLLGSQWVNPYLRSPMSVCMTGQLGQLSTDNNPAGSLKMNCQSSDCTDRNYISLPGMEHMSVELRKKYVVIHINGITLNIGKSADLWFISEFILD